MRSAKEQFESLDVRPPNEVSQGPNSRSWGLFLDSKTVQVLSHISMHEWGSLIMGIWSEKLLVDGGEVATIRYLQDAKLLYHRSSVPQYVFYHPAALTDTLGL